MLFDKKKKAAKKEIKASGIAVMLFPQGTQWGTETVKIVNGDADTAYKMLSGEE